MKAVALRSVPLTRLPSGLVRRGDWIYHHLIVGWVVAIAVTVGQTVLTTIAQYGPSSALDLVHWEIVRWVFAHPFPTFGILIGILDLHLVFWAIHTTAHPAIDPFSVHTTRMRDVDLRAAVFKQGTQRIAPRFHRPVFDQVHATLQQVLQQGYGGIVLSGPTGIGKTRLAVEVLQRLVPQDLLIVWPPGDVPLEGILRYQGRRVIVLLDDLQERITQVERIRLGIERLRAVADRVILVLIYRSGSHEAEVLQQFEHLLDPLERGIVVAAIQGDERGAFRHYVQTQTGSTWDDATFDGTPASILLNLERRTRQLKSSPPELKAGLKAMALLRAAGCSAFPESRLQRVAEGVFQLPGSLWPTTRDTLLADDWWQRIANNGSGIAELRIVADAFLDVCLVNVGYPAPGTVIADDFAQLVAVLARPPTDSVALFALADTVRFAGGEGFGLDERTLLAQALQGISRDQDPVWWAAAQLRVGIAANEAQDQEMAIQACTAALEELTPEQQPLDWAAASNNLGNAYQHRTVGERSVNQELAIHAYEQSLTIYTQAAFPEKWADTQMELAEIFEEREQGTRAQNIDRKIDALQKALQGYTRERTPDQWTKAQNTLGMTYLQRQSGFQSENAHRATAHLQAALQAITREQARYQWAIVQTNLGNAYRLWTEDNPAAHAEQAIQCHNAALIVFTLDDYRDQWAWTHSCLAEDYVVRVHGAKAENIEQSIQHSMQAGTVYTREDHPVSWAIVQALLGMTVDERRTGPTDFPPQYEALQYYQQALEVIALPRSPLTYARINWNMSLIYERLMLDAQKRHDNVACRVHQSAASSVLQQAIKGYRVVDQKHDQQKAERQLETVKTQQC